MDIRRIAAEEYDEMKSLVMEVFMQFEAPDYGEQGVETFRRTGIDDEAYLSSLSIYGAYIENRMTGIIATRNSGMHIALFFVKGDSHRQGIGRALFETVKKNGILVNSSPFAEKVYERLGFIRTDEEQSFEGIRFIPMKYAPETRMLLNSFTQKDNKAAYQEFLEMEAISEVSNALYSYAKLFAEMASSNLYVLRVRGFRLLCRQAKWDIDSRLDNDIERSLEILNDSKPTAVRMALAVLPELLKHKPKLRDIIIEAVKSIDYLKYSESMQGLIEKDIKTIIEE